MIWRMSSATWYSSKTLSKELSRVTSRTGTRPARLIKQMILRDDDRPFTKPSAHGSPSRRHLRSKKAWMPTDFNA